MSQLTPAQINLLRSRPQSTQLFLSFYQPKTIFQAQVTGTYSQGDLRISFSGITTGSWWNIYPNLTTRIGSTLGADDVGELRVRSASGTYIDFAENEIIWTQGMYLTCIDYINVEAVYPRIIQDPSSQTNVIFYKDWNIPYSNQNTIYGTFPCAGSHRAGFIVTGAWSTYYTSTGTYNVNGDSLTYSWAFEGGTPTGSTTKDPGFVRYTTPGHYKTRFITTSSSGAVDTTYRYVSAYQNPSQGTNNPIEAWNISELSGSRGEGGYTARIKIMSIMPELQPHTLIVIFAEDNFGGTPVSLGSNSPNQESIVFVGYVLADSIKFNYQQSTMEFDVGSVSEIMKEAEGFSVSCESKASATTWYELTEMTVEKALYHYLRWHSTVLNVNDFQYTNTDRYVQYFDSDRESLFDAIDNFMRNGLLGSVVTDRQGKLWAEIEHFGRTQPFDTQTNPLILNKQDWMGDPTIQEHRDSEVSFIELGGIAYYGVTTNTFSALISNAPGTTPLYHGKTERQEGLILLSQQQLNQVAANYLAYKNTQFHEISLSINGNYRNIDIAPQEKFYLVISPSDTIRNVSLQDKPFTPISMTWKYDSVNQTFTPDLVLEAMATGTAAETVLIPVTPPYVNSGFDYPALQLPTLPIFNPSDAIGPNAPQIVVIKDATNGLLYTTDFDSASPTWQFFNGGLTVGQKQSINFFFQTPSGACYCGFTRNGDSSANGCFVARAPTLGGLWVILYSQANLQTHGGAWGVLGASYNPTVSESVGLVMYDDTNLTAGFYIGGGTTFTRSATFADYSGVLNVSFGATKWMCTGFGAQPLGGIRLVSVDGVTVTAPVASIPGNLNPSHVRAGVGGITFHDRIGGGLFVATDNWTAYTEITDTLIGFTNASETAQNPVFAVDSSGFYGMTRYGPSGKGRTSDQGFTWGLITNLILSNWWWAYAGGSTTSSRWVVAGGIEVFYSENWGNSWSQKLGNLWTLIPIPNLTMVRALGI